MTPFPHALLIARNRAFWSTDASRVLFPHQYILPERPLRVMYVWYFVSAVIRIAITNPTIIILGTTTPLSPLFARCRRLGLFKKKIFFTDHQFLSSRDVSQFDGVWVYSREEIGLYDAHVQHRFTFFHYPSKLQLSPVAHTHGEYVFAGGNHKRDHESFLMAMNGLPYKGVVVTDRILSIPVPNNCVVRGHMPLTDYMSTIAQARFVVIPLLAGDIPHGHGDISVALSLGKPVITTSGASVGEYVIEGVNGLLVAPGDVEGYRTAIQSLFEDAGLFQKLETGARATASQFSYETFAENLCTFINAVVARKKKGY